MIYQTLDVSKLKIVHYPDPALTQKARPIDQITSEIVDLGEKMVDLMVKDNGIGLAAPQVGISLRVIVVSLTGKAEDAEILINPELSNFSGTSEMEEGCLSLPGIRAKVRRPASCTVKAMDLEGNEFVTDAVDLAATVFQHETDHLNGTLFVDRLNTVSRMGVRRGLKMLEREYKG